MGKYEIGQLRGAFGAGVAAANKANGKAEQEGSLVGKSFHNFRDGGIVQNQGRVLSEPTSGVFLIQFYSWLDGRETSQKLVPLSEMMDWAFYPNDDEMKTAYDNIHEPKLRAHNQAQLEQQRQNKALHPTANSAVPSSSFGASGRC